MCYDIYDILFIDQYIAKVLIYYVTAFLYNCIYTLYFLLFTVGDYNLACCYSIFLSHKIAYIIVQIYSCLDILFIRGNIYYRYGYSSSLALNCFSF
ncbi:uncharacterized protein BX663DRAFT_515867 [Cokeromyces recurvatus]|uniref:uncharacterized protein n=1 Tax=Cokeromyces recurvatus TaxID=90255 RepID=UPI0022200B9C|nr:uncharacterized protein BX663DRAFT_515867 [Cokeromyces recurvatus]KAI7900962.1 hypothetical protein BX663DRAFT_515867 [Cokeromyces recurvatus]